MQNLDGDPSNININLCDVHVTSAEPGNPLVYGGNFGTLQV